MNTPTTSPWAVARETRDLQRLEHTIQGLIATEHDVRKHESKYKSEWWHSTGRLDALYDVLDEVQGYLGQ